MILRCDQIAKKLESSGEDEDPLVIIPTPDLVKLKGSGAASIDLRLGTFFLTPRARRLPYLDVVSASESRKPEARLVKGHYVAFNKPFYLHPGKFVLAATLEWVRLPTGLSAYVIGKSSWGRRGLVIATATGVHPRFAGCLTLELANLGEIPCAIRPGMEICQLFIERVTKPLEEGLADRSTHVARRRPQLGTVEVDEIARVLGADPEKD